MIYKGEQAGSNGLQWHRQSWNWPVTSRLDQASSSKGKEQGVWLRDAARSGESMRRRRVEGCRVIRLPGCLVILQVG